MSVGEPLVPPRAPSSSAVHRPLVVGPSAGKAGLYSRSRGHGADDMLLNGDGLWIDSDNFGGGTSCGGQAGFSGLCFLPYPS